MKSTCSQHLNIADNQDAIVQIWIEPKKLALKIDQMVGGLALT